MRSWRNRVSVIFLALAMMTGVSVIATTPASAAACYGASCNGLDPQGRCSSDAQTVRAIDVGDGMLQLRWSPSCAANWGRFTAYTRTELGYLSSHIVIHARVTVWNPDKPSYGTAHHSLGVGESTWSFMTDGRPKACTGVEITHVYQAESGSGAIDYQSQGWTWGPCY